MTRFKVFIHNALVGEGVNNPLIDLYGVFVGGSLKDFNLRFMQVAANHGIAPHDILLEDAVRNRDAWLGKALCNVPDEAAFAAQPLIDHSYWPDF